MYSISVPDAERQRPWVDRLASAWLVRRFIDPQARIHWIASPQECPADALGFDFDGATFSHVGSRVTFEVLLASFGLEQPALARLGLLVHYLDVGGIEPAESAGVESILAGLREALCDDDQLLAAAHDPRHAQELGCVGILLRFWHVAPPSDQPERH